MSKPWRENWKNKCSICEAPLRGQRHERDGLFFCSTGHLDEWKRRDAEWDAWFRSDDYNQFMQHLQNGAKL